MCTRRNGGTYSMKNTIVNKKETMATYRVRITFRPLSVPECVSHSRGVKQAGGHAIRRDKLLYMKISSPSRSGISRGTSAKPPMSRRRIQSDGADRGLF